LQKEGTTNGPDEIIQHDDWWHAQNNMRKSYSTGRASKIITRDRDAQRRLKITLFSDLTLGPVYARLGFLRSG
jgi:hypothetical protein